MTATATYRKLAIRLQWATIGWNVGEVFVTVGLGIAAGSLGLVGFGMDSLIEVFASLVVVGHLRRMDGRSEVAHRRIGWAFFALAAALTVLAVERLASRSVPDESPWGVAYLTATVIVMWGLAFLKRRVGRLLGDGPVAAEASMTFLDGWLAFGVLVSLVVNALWGWWWADPAAALLVAAAAVREGMENFEESRA